MSDAKKHSNESLGVSIAHNHISVIFPFVSVISLVSSEANWHIDIIFPLFLPCEQRLAVLQCSQTSHYLHMSAVWKQINGDLKGLISQALELNLSRLYILFS